MALAETITVPDIAYDAETAEKITLLRHERWALLCIMSLNVTRRGNSIFDELAMSRIERRLKEVQKELFDLTDNPIYDVK